MYYIIPADAMKICKGGPLHTGGMRYTSLSRLNGRVLFFWEGELLIVAPFWR